MERVCRSCKLSKDSSEFPSNGWQRRADGSRVQVWKADCKVCHNAESMRAFNQLLNTMVREWKCSRCGYDRCAEALDFHHVDQNTKKFEIAARASISRRLLQEEVDKCILLCSNCHRELHANLWSLGD